MVPVDLPLALPTWRLFAWFKQHGSTADVWARADGAVASARRCGDAAERNVIVAPLQRFVSNFPGVRADGVHFGSYNLEAKWRSARAGAERFYGPNTAAYLPFLASVLRARETQLLNQTTADGPQRAAAGARASLVPLTPAEEVRVVRCYAARYPDLRPPAPEMVGKRGPPRSRRRRPSRLRHQRLEKHRNYRRARYCSRRGDLSSCDLAELRKHYRLHGTFEGRTYGELCDEK